MQHCLPVQYPSGLQQHIFMSQDFMLTPWSSLSCTGSDLLWFVLYLFMIRCMHSEIQLHSPLMFNAVMCYKASFVAQQEPQGYGVCIRMNQPGDIHQNIPLSLNNTRPHYQQSTMPTTIPVPQSLIKPSTESILNTSSCRSLSPSQKYEHTVSVIFLLSRSAKDSL